jgi:hypothetical protein
MVGPAGARLLCMRRFAAKAGHFTRQGLGPGRHQLVNPPGPTPLYKATSATRASLPSRPSPSKGAPAGSAPQHRGLQGPGRSGPPPGVRLAAAANGRVPRGGAARRRGRAARGRGGGGRRLRGRHGAAAAADAVSPGALVPAVWWVGEPVPLHLACWAPLPDGKWVDRSADLSKAFSPSLDPSATARLTGPAHNRATAAPRPPRHRHRPQPRRRSRPAWPFPSSRCLAPTRTARSRRPPPSSWAGARAGSSASPRHPSGCCGGSWWVPARARPLLGGRPAAARRWQGGACTTRARGWGWPRTGHARLDCPHWTVFERREWWAPSSPGLGVPTAPRLPPLLPAADGAAPRRRGRRPPAEARDAGKGLPAFPPLLVCSLPARYGLLPHCRRPALRPKSHSRAGAFAPVLRSRAAAP